MAQDGSWRTIESVETALRIIDVLQEDDGARISELADALDLAPSTIHAHVKTLEQEQFVVREGDEYYVGLRFFDIGGQAAYRRDEYKHVVQKVKKLTSQTGERSQFIVEEDGRGYYLTTETADQDVPLVARVGKRRPLHSSAAGKAILSELSRERVDEIIDQWGLKAMTENTITDETELFAELDRTRERGYAINDEESIKGLKAVGAPVKDENDDVVGAISLSSPSNRLQDDRIESEMVNHVLGIANEIELNLHHS